MADTNVLQTINIGDNRFSVKTCWEQLELTKHYLLALLSRDEYTPIANMQPSSTDTLYTDPVSGNPAGFHAGQCVVYPDVDVKDGWGLSIAKYVFYDDQGIPTKILWYHATDIEKRIASLEENVAKIFYGCLGMGLWVNEFPWQNDAVWSNGI